MYVIKWCALVVLLTGFYKPTKGEISQELQDDMEEQRKNWDLGTPPKVEIQLTEKDEAFFKDMRTKRLIDIRAGFSNPGIRQELRCMTKEKRLNYFKTVNIMKSTMVGAVPEYDELAARHLAKFSRPAHNCISFLPWHREFLTSFELALQSRCPGCMQPYWDNRLEQRLEANPVDSVYFSKHLMGNSNGSVVTGLPADWVVYFPNCQTKGKKELQRFFRNSVDDLYQDRDVHMLDDAKDIKEFAKPWTKKVEDVHSYIHSLFGKGSQMQNVECSPSDPIFYQHHCLLDMIFEGGRQSLIKNNALVYPDLTDSTLSAERKKICAAKAPMMPFVNRTNDYGLLSDTYTKDIYKYEKSPGDVNCVQDSDCCANGNVEFLWCNAKGRCVSKVAEGGRVKPLFPDKACYCETGTPKKVNQLCACV